MTLSKHAHQAEPPLDPDPDERRRAAAAARASAEREAVRRDRAASGIATPSQADWGRVGGLVGGRPPKFDDGDREAVRRLAAEHPGSRPG